MKYVILLSYAMALWYWFLDIIQDEEMTNVDRLIAIFPPLGCSFGIVGFLFFYDTKLASQVYILFFLLGIAGILWDLKDFNKKATDWGWGLVAVVVSLIGIIPIIFGPGFYYGYQWIVRHIT